MNIISLYDCNLPEGRDNVPINLLILLVITNWYACANFSTFKSFIERMTVFASHLLFAKMSARYKNKHVIKL